MDKSITNLFRLLCLGIVGCVTTQCTEVEKKTITIDFATTYQTIDGFGVGEADWADDVFIFPKREEVLDALFGKDGLSANILRGEIFPHYSNAPGHTDFALKSDTSNSVVRSAASVERNDLLRRGQFWLTSRVQQKYPETLFTFSVWSPPAWMKQGGHSTPLYPASHGSLKKEHYQNFADYLVDFCKEFQTIGVNTYAISPSNEPGFAAPWNSCVWTSDEMGEFIHDYLLPAFSKNQLDTKVQFGENPAWSTVFDKLKKISSADFVNSVLKAYPDMDPERVIAVGHGYVLPDTIPLPAELRRTPIVPFEEAQKRNIPMWVTEISDITPLDVSIKDGLYWADMFQKYLMDAHVSAIVWWLGAQPTTTNESLIVLDNKSGNYILSKRYDAFGNYTRYIPAGSQCVANSTEGLPEGVSVSSFRKDNKYTVVVVNTTNEAVRCNLDFKGGNASGDLNSYTTDADARWKHSSVNEAHGRYLINLPPQSVVTYTGDME